MGALQSKATRTHIPSHTNLSFSAFCNKRGLSGGSMGCLSKMSAITGLGLVLSDFREGLGELGFVLD